MRKKTVRILSLFLVLCTVISATSIQAFALSWDGSSTGGGGNTTAAKKMDMPSEPMEITV